MSNPIVLGEDLRVWLIDILSSRAFQQVAPLVILILVPIVVLGLAQPAKRFIESLVYSFLMGLESLGLSIPWIWSWNGAGNTLRKSAADNWKGKKRHPRTRAEQLVLNGSENDDDLGEAVFYPGLVNISGTYCFMNSTLQALASLSYLQPHIDAVHAKAEAVDVPTPVIDALQALFDELNTPTSYPSSLRPMQIIAALSSYSATNRSNALLHSREHQDAQELFQLLSECIKSEISAIDKEQTRDRGFGGAVLLASTPLSQSMSLSQSTSPSQSLITSPEAETGERWIGKSVFDGLTANRRSCVECGYTEAVMHFAFDNWQLSVPPTTGCRLEDCLADYTRLELLTDCICRKCSLLATHRRLSSELKALEEALKPGSSTNSTSHSKSAFKGSTKSSAVAETSLQKNERKKPTPSKKRRAKDVAKMEAQVKNALDQGRIEDDLKGVRIERVISRASTKQAMVARPPIVLALHLNRSSFSYYAAKNSAFVAFPEILDLTPFTTSGILSTIPSVPISTPMLSTPLPLSLPPRSKTPTADAYSQVRERVLYRLTAVVCHYGSHSFGHYVCFRRKPRPKGKVDRWMPPTLVDPLIPEERDINSGAESLGGRARLIFEGEELLSPGRGWLRVSDDSVRECGIETVLREGSGAFMLYYERIKMSKPNPYPSLGTRRSTSNVNGSVQANGDCSPQSSEETLKPELRTLQLNMLAGMDHSAQSLVSEVGIGVLRRGGKGDDVEGKYVHSNKGLTQSISSSSSSLGIGPRIVRNVSTGRTRSPSDTPSERNPLVGEGSPATSSNPDLRKSHTLRPLAKGDNSQYVQPAYSPPPSVSKRPLASSSPPSSLTTSISKSSLSSSTSSLSSSLSSSPPHRNQRLQPSSSIHSPQPHPPSPVVGLKA